MSGTPFQYLALTWYANRLRERRTGKRIGFLHLWEDLGSKRARRDTGCQRQRCSAGRINPQAGWRRRCARCGEVDRDTGWSTFYMLCLSMLPISGMLILAAGTFWPAPSTGTGPGSDEAYTYMGILSDAPGALCHEALLFTDHDAIVAEDLATVLPSHNPQ